MRNKKNGIAHTFYVLHLAAAATFGWIIFENASPNFAGNMVKLCLRILCGSEHSTHIRMIKQNRERARLWQTICWIYNHLHTLHFTFFLPFCFCFGCFCLPCYTQIHANISFYFVFNLYVFRVNIYIYINSMSEWVSEWVSGSAILTMCDANAVWNILHLAMSIFLFPFNDRINESFWLALQRFVECGWIMEFHFHKTMFKKGTYISIPPICKWTRKK